MINATQPVVIAPPLEKNHTSIFLLFLLFALFYYFDYLLGPYAQVRIHDTFDNNFLQYVIQGKLLLKYGLFGWNPALAGGMPSFANHHPPYYILSLVSAFVPLWFTYEFLCVGFMALAGYGMFRMLQVLFQVDRRVAILGGILFALGNAANVTTVINEVFNYLFPIFFVWSIELFQYRLSIIQKSLRVFGLLIISVLSYAVLTLPFFPILHLALVLAYGKPRESLKRLVLQTILIWTGYVLLFVPYIYALFDYIPFAQRTYDGAYHGFFNSLRDFAYIFATQLLRLPVAPLFICGLPLLRSSRNFRRAAILVIMYMGIFTFFQSPFRYLLADTFLLKMDLTNFLQPVIILLTISAALFLAETLSFRLDRLSILACVIAFAASFLPIPCSNPFIGISALVMGLSLRAITRIGNSPETSGWQDSFAARLLFMGFVIAVAVMGMAGKTDIRTSLPYARLYNNHPELNLSPRDGSAAVFRVGTVDVLPGVAQIGGLETINARGVLFNKYYKQLIKAIILPQLQDPEDEKFFDTYSADLYLTTQSSSRYPPDQRPVTSWSLPLLLMMNVKYLIARQPIVGIEPFVDLDQKIDGRGLPFKFLKNTKADNLFKMPLYLYRFKETFARGYLVKTPVILSDRQAVMTQLINQRTADLREKVFFFAGDITPRPWPESLPTTTGIADVDPDLIEYSPDRLVFQGNLKSPAFLVVTNNYDPHWFAWVNGQPSTVYRANVAFQSVFINQTGPFLVVLEYHHPIIWWLHLVSILGIVLFIASAWVTKSGETFHKPMPPACAHPKNPFGNISLQKRAQKRYRRLGLLGGVVVSLLYAAYLIYVILTLRRLADSALLASSLGRNIYELAVVPTVGILLSIWIIICERFWHLFSTSSYLEDSPLSNNLSGRESPRSSLYSKIRRRLF